MLGTLPNEDKINWPEHVTTLVHAYNCTKFNSTGISPDFLLYGRHPMLPIETEFGVRTANIKYDATHKYVQYGIIK